MRVQAQTVLRTLPVRVHVVCASAADGCADKNTDGRGCRLDFDGARVGQHMDVELLGAVQHQFRALLHPGGGLAAGWAAHTGDRSPSVPQPNQRDVSAWPTTRSSARASTHARNHSRARSVHVHVLARPLHGPTCTREAESIGWSSPRLVCVYHSAFGRCHRCLSNNLLNGTLPDSLAALTRLEKMYATPLRCAVFPLVSLLCACKPATDGCAPAAIYALQEYNSQHVRRPDSECAHVHTRFDQRPHFLPADVPGLHASARAGHAIARQLRLGGLRVGVLARFDCARALQRRRR